MSPRHISGKAWGGATQGHDGKIKPGRKKPNPSKSRYWAKNKGKTKVISRKAASKLPRLL